jgi:hypothetical protein
MGIIMDDDDLFTSKKMSPEENDPVVFALNEMRQTATQQKPQISAPHQSPQPQKQAVFQDSSTLPQNQKTDQPNEEKGDDKDEWYHNVPIWFWCLFGGLIVSTIFLVGIIIMLILGKL